jgi:hypothetical protein
VSATAASRATPYASHFVQQVDVTSNDGTGGYPGIGRFGGDLVAQDDHFALAHEPFVRNVDARDRRELSAGTGTKLKTSRRFHDINEGPIVLSECSQHARAPHQRHCDHRANTSSSCFSCCCYCDTNILGGLSAAYVACRVGTLENKHARCNALFSVCPSRRSADCRTQAPQAAPQAPHLRRPV